MLNTGTTKAIPGSRNTKQTPRFRGILFQVFCIFGQIFTSMLTLFAYIFSIVIAGGLAIYAYALISEAIRLLFGRGTNSKIPHEITKTFRGW
jgi:hypothetical protein